MNLFGFFSDTLRKQTFWENGITAIGNKNSHFLSRKRLSCFQDLKYRMYGGFQTVLHFNMLTKFGRNRCFVLVWSLHAFTDKSTSRISLKVAYLKIKTGVKYNQNQAMCVRTNYLLRIFSYWMWDSIFLNQFLLLSDVHYLLLI